MVNDIAKAKKKMRVGHYEALLLDFGVNKSEFSEECGGKVVRLKAKDLCAYFWSRADVVEQCHVYQDGDSSDSYDEVDTSSSEDDDDETPQVHMLKHTTHVLMINVLTHAHYVHMHTVTWWSC